MSRKSYTILLEISPTAPLTHGSGTEGNEQILATREVLVPDGHGGYEREEIPIVSGAALKATLREWAVRDALERAGVAEGSVSRDALRLLLKGGKNDSGGASVSLEEARRLRDLFPLLAVFGSMDGGLPIKAQITCSDVMPYCAEGVASGMVPTKLRPLEVWIEGSPANESPIEYAVWPGVNPIPVASCRTTTQNYRHDMMGGSLAPMLQGPQLALIEDAREARKGKPAKASERREANESMPHSAQAIAAGTPMVATIRLQGATEVEFATLAVAISRWVTAGGHLGGGSTKGHGACRVRVAGAIRYAPPVGEAPIEMGTAIDVIADGQQHPLARIYAAHVAERAERIRAFVGESTR
ncbi:MAG: hypothetical protein A2Y38_23735 [Spirochaetes bacterium GWB1_59_5]|nr:MAG: hypothetical protein A2Y38_23735 [Spirochaetes bacterium GWB1_59_5]